MPLFTKIEIDVALDNFTDLTKQAMLESISTRKQGPNSKNM